MTRWFDDIPVIGAMPNEEAGRRLLEIGATDDAAALVNPVVGEDQFGIFDRRLPAYRHTAHVVGYVGELTAGGVPAQSIGEIEPDPDLRSRPLRISLGKLAAIDYPGKGNHIVLCDLSVRHTTTSEAQDLHYAVVIRAAEGERAGVLNQPIFVGVNPGEEGLCLKGYTVNVKNEQDEKLLRYLESDTMRRGLTLLNTMQPALAPLTEIAYGLTRTLAQRHRNQPVQNFTLGLDFSRQAFGAALRLGAYIVVQIPPELQYAWDWSNWIYEPLLGDLVSRAEPGQGIEYNHLVFTVSLAMS
jgi:hypothetical protein